MNNKSRYKSKEEKGRQGNTPAKAKPTFIRTKSPLYSKKHWKNKYTSELRISNTQKSYILVKTIMEVKAFHAT